MSGNGQLDPPSPRAILRAERNDRDTSTEGPGERRFVTVLCYDLVGSTALMVQSDVEDFQELMLAFQRSAIKAVASRGGSVKELGDGGLALFPHGNDARDVASLAIHAGLEIVDTCINIGRKKGRPDMRVRVGIATSIALVRRGQQTLTPDNVTAIALAKATRLQGMAEPNTVLVSQQTRGLARRSHAFRFQGVRQMKGLAEPEQIWRALPHRRGVGRFYAFGRLNIPLVGRAAELQTIADCWRAAVAGQGCILLIQGEAGIGKSRLLHEVRRMTRLERNRMLLFQCSPGGSRSTLQPLLQSFPSVIGEGAGKLTTAAVANLFGHHGIQDPDVINVFSFLLGTNDFDDQTLREASPEVVYERTGRAVRRALELLCADGPVVLAAEDIHWIDPTSQYLLLELARTVHRYPAVLALTTRAEAPGELLQLPRVEQISLTRLDPDETRSAIAALWGRSEPSEAELPDLINRITGGVPLFIEEICQWMVENAWFTTSQLANAVSPGATSVLESVLNARIEPLGSAKDVIRAAAVVGSQFDLKLLKELVPDLDEEEILLALDRLSEVGFLVRARSQDGAFYSFRHALIQETIYNASLRKTREAYHSRLFSALDRNRDIASWFSTATIADHAERAGLIKEAIRYLIVAGKDSSARSAMVEARHLLEHALNLCDRIDEPGQRDAMKLSGLAALGPVLISTEGPGSPTARNLYESAVEIARRRPVSERATWFAVYWGWWFTGADVDNKRAQAILSELKDVDDPEVQLQIRHCIWAIDFYLGQHGSCIAAVDAGLTLYEVGRGGENFTLYGGHDAKVCGLSHKGLSEWLTGRATSALRSVSQARQWALHTGHVGSIAHAYYNEAMLYCYRRDYPALMSIVKELRPLTEQYRLRSLAAAMEIFEGWCEGNAGHLDRGQEMIRKGLETHAELQTPEDYPVYCSMMAELWSQTGKSAEGLALLSSAAANAEQSGHHYWLAELHNRRARLLAQEGAGSEAVVAALSQSLETASRQNAIPLLLDAYDTLEKLALSPEIASRYRSLVELARSRLEPGEALIVNPERSGWRSPAGRAIE